MHPGKVLKIIMIEHGLYTYNDMGGEEVSVTSVQNEFNFNSYINTKDLLNGDEDIGYTVAYKLGSRIKGTDMAFWLKLQKDYDEHKENETEDRYDVVTDLIQLREAELYLVKLNKDMEQYRESCVKESIDNDMSESIRSLDEEIAGVNKIYSKDRLDKAKRVDEYCAIRRGILEDILENILELDNDDHMRIKSDIKKIYDVHGWEWDV